MINEKKEKNYFSDFFFLQSIFFRRFSIDRIDVAWMIHRSLPSCVFCCCCVLFCYLLPVDTRVKRTKKKIIVHRFIYNIETRKTKNTLLRVIYLPNSSLNISEISFVLVDALLTHVILSSLLIFEIQFLF